MKLDMVKLWIFLDFMAKKKLDLDEVYFWHKSTSTCWKRKETGFAKLPWSRWRFPARVFRFEVSFSHKYKHQSNTNNL